MGQAGGSASPRSLSKAAPAEGLGSCPRPSQQQALRTAMLLPEPRKASHVPWVRAGQPLGSHPPVLQFILPSLTST